jgi:chemotaxis protein methyltransferase CheR
MGTEVQLSKAAVERIRELIHGVAGIALGHDKDSMIRARLAGRLRQLQVSSYELYLERVSRDRDELSELVDLLTTNKTSFFREMQHFDFIANELVPHWQRLGRDARIWSAACSTGEEPYSVAMLLKSYLPLGNPRILATDISRRVLKSGEQARFPVAFQDSIPREYRQHLAPVRGDDTRFEIKPEVRKLVSFARLNLMNQWPMRERFDLILCRNVMIYFEPDTRAELARRFAECLTDDGYLFIGHTESLQNLDQPLCRVQPAIYSHHDALP